MDYNQLLAQVNKADLFDLYRLHSAIDAILSQPERIKGIKQAMKTGMQIAYFNPGENRMVAASVEEMRRTELTVRNSEDGMRRTIRYPMVNLGGDYGSSHPDIEEQTKHPFKAGDTVGFRDIKGSDQVGEILKLIPKTDPIMTKFGTKLRVEYEFVTGVMNAAPKQEPTPAPTTAYNVETLLPENDMKSATETDEQPISDTKARLLALRKKRETKKTASQPPPSGKHGRNQPCPCGSGRRYKKCCMGKSKLP